MHWSIISFLVCCHIATPAIAQRAMNQAMHHDSVYQKIKYIIPDRDKGEVVDADLTLRFDYLEIRSNAGVPLKKFKYSEITSADYSFSKHPRWKSGTAAAIAVGVFAIPVFFMKGKKHWYTIQTDSDFAVLRLDKSNFRIVTAAVDNKIQLHQNVTPESSRETVVSATTGRPVAPEPTFRNTFWGMSREDVIGSEGDDVHLSKPGYITYYRNVLGRDVGVAYYFESARLVRARYVFEESDRRPQESIRDFEEVKGALVQKYGQAAEDTLVWTNDLYREDPSRLAEALQLRHVTFLARWTTPETKIVANLMTLPDGVTSLMVEYSELKKVDDAF